MVVVKLNSGDLFLYNPVKVRNETGMVWEQLENWKDGGKKFYCKKKGILSGQNCQNNDKVLKDLNTPWMNSPKFKVVTQSKKIKVGNFLENDFR